MSQETDYLNALEDVQARQTKHEKRRRGAMLASLGFLAVNGAALYVSLKTGIHEPAVGIIGSGVGAVAGMAFGYDAVQQGQKAAALEGALTADRLASIRQGTGELTALAAQAAHNAPQH